MKCENRVVSPGEALAGAEEYLPEQNTYDDGEHIRAAAMGHPCFDSQEHTVSVQSNRPVQLMAEGDTVIGRVSFLKKNMVSIEIVYAESPEGQARVVHARKAAILVHEISQDYVEDLRDAFRTGDIIRGRISELKPYGINVKTNEPDLGVILAYSVKDRSPLSLVHGKLVSTKSGSGSFGEETRKISSNYVISHEVEQNEN